ncbi:MAG: GNAT family N-acetyltransferase [Firmicutes bacterium]|nr:GNAT family N-acetyltransferase [Bacillota bacterium]MCL5015339.1 GNAT family N-acetyltransferase [Bacillota bacterium]
MSIHPHSPQAPWPWDLLLLADPSRTRIQNYCRDGLCYVAQWHEEIVGVYVIALNTDGGAELMNIAVREDWQGQGLGQRLVQHAENTARNLGCLWLDVATGNSSLLQLRFYQRAGFRITDIVPDFFVLHYNQLIMENGIPCRDQIRLRKQLVADAP